MDTPVLGGEELTQAIDALLPQTQCGKCGFGGCRPYAEAIAAGTSPINRCPPGGAAGIEKLAALLGTDPIPLDISCGTEKAAQLALIDEVRCIGCTLCIQACPVDAIVGAPKKMHTVLLAHCTGCELCLPPCPVDCIDLVDVERLASTEASGALARHALSPTEAAAISRRRYLARNTRIAANEARPPRQGEDAAEQKREAVMQALNRARAQRRAPKMAP